MKRYFEILALGVALVLGSSCKEDQIKVWEGEHFIHFTQESKDLYRFSFATVPGQDEYELKIPVTLVGSAYDEDKTYKVAVVKEVPESMKDKLVTNVSDEVYSIPENPVFGKGQYEDTLSVILYNKAELSEEKVLKIQVVDNDNFKMGPIKNRYATIMVSNFLTQPSWWDDVITTVYLGAYSSIKYQSFILATGVTDMSEMKDEEVKVHVRDFVYWLREKDAAGQTVYESDGTTKVEDTVPYAKKI